VSWIAGSAIFTMLTSSSDMQTVTRKIVTATRWVRSGITGRVSVGFGMSGQPASAMRPTLSIPAVAARSSLSGGRR